jgi:predicted ribosome quality control (RQC) complex YloA/Tae2 family protein
MATMAGMSGIDVRAVVCELRSLLPLWINKVYQFQGALMGMRFNGEEHAKYQLLVEPGKRLHLVKDLPEPPKIPPSFAMLLRKYINGGRVLDIRQYGLSRIVIFDIGKSGITYHLVIELFDSGNVIFCDENYTIIKPLSHHRFKDRDIVPGARYIIPGNDPTLLDDAGFFRYLKGDEREIIKTLAIGCLLGGTYAEYICRETGIDKQARSDSVEAGKVKIALEALLKRAETDREPVITEGGCLPFMTSGSGIISRYPTFNEALAAYYPVKAQQIKGIKKGTKKLPKEEVIRRHQEEAVKKFSARISRLERAVEAIYENYSLITEIISTLDAASKNYSWQEIGEIVAAHKNGPAGKIVAIHPGDAAVELDIGERVTIHVHENIEVNLGRYFSEIKKYKKKISGARAAMDRPLPKKAVSKPHAPILKKKWYHRFRWFITSDGTVVLGGRDASQNEELVKKYMEGGDTFVHADVHGASVVIIKGKTEHMDEVNQFAASYSGAWRSGHFSADVYSVRPDQVSKTPESGEYVSRGSFIIRGERTYARDVPLGIAIGLQMEPEIAVIGGPPTPVRLRAKYLVDLKPGQYEPNDTAKKVLRLLRDNIPEGEWKALKSVLNTETVAGFVPPGGSDIVEAL